MFLAEAALGDPYIVDRDNRAAQQLVKAPYPHDSVMTTSQTAVPAKNDIKIKLGGHDVSFATGKPVAVKDSESTFHQAEYLVYSPAQVRLRYLVLVGKKDATGGGGSGKRTTKGKAKAKGTQPLAQGWFWSGDSDPVADPGAQDVKVAYGKTVQARIEAAFLSGEASLSIDSERYIDFGNMVQCRIDDPSKCRTVFRI